MDVRAARDINMLRNNGSVNLSAAPNLQKCVRAVEDAIEGGVAGNPASMVVTCLEATRKTIAAGLLGIPTTVWPVIWNEVHNR